MSPRAACQLEQLGFTQVYDYVLGLADWKAAGRPTDGTETSVQRVAEATRPDVPTCDPGESIESVWIRTETAGWDECLVIECDGLVVGRLRGEAWTKNRELLAGDVMEFGPTTVRSVKKRSSCCRGGRRNRFGLTATVAQANGDSWKTHSDDPISRSPRLDLERRVLHEASIEAVLG